MASQILQVTETGDVTTRDAYLQAATLTAGADAATLTLRAGGASGTVVLVVNAALDTTVVAANLHGAYCGQGIHATVTGTDPSATIVFT